MTHVTHHGRIDRSRNPVTHSDTKWRAGDLELLIALAKAPPAETRPLRRCQRTHRHRRLAEPGFRTQLDTLRQRLITAASNTKPQHPETPPRERLPCEHHRPQSPEQPTCPTSTPHRSQSPTRRRQSPTPFKKRPPYSQS